LSAENLPTIQKNNHKPLTRNPLLMSAKITIAFVLLLFAAAGTLPAQNLKATLKMTRGWCKQMGGDQSWPPDPTWKTRASIKTSSSDTGVNGEICRYLDNYRPLLNSPDCNSGLEMFSSFIFPGNCAPREKVYDDLILTYQPSSYNFSLADGFYVTINMEAWEDDKGGICDINSGDDDVSKKDSTFWMRIPNGATFPYHYDFTLRTENQAFRVSYRLTVENLDAISNTSMRVANSAGTTQNSFCSGDPVRLYADRRAGFSGGYFEWQRRATPSSSWVSATSTTYTTSNFLEVSAANPMPDYRVRVAQSGANGTATQDGWIEVSGSTITVAPAPPALSNIATTITGACSGSSNGAIQVVVSNSNASSQYLLTLVNSSNQTVSSHTPALGSTLTHTFTGLSAGTYKVKVGFSGSSVDCTTQTGNITVNTLQLPVISASGAAGNCAGENGSVTVNITSNASGTNTYTLLNATGNTVLQTQNTTQASYTFSVAAGTYRVRVTNGNGCQSALSGQVTVPNAPSAVAASAAPVSVGGIYHIRCFGGEGAVQIIPSGGTPPYRVGVAGLPLIFNIQSGQTVSFSRPAGTYAYTVTDSKGCTANGSVTLVQPPQNLSVAISNIQQASDCAPTGSATFGGSGGSGTYQYSLDNPSGPYTTNPVFNNLAAGAHIAYIRDLTGCQANASFNVGAPNPLLLEVTAVSNVLCAGSNEGSVTLSASGGNPPYQFRIGNGAFSAQNTFNGLTADTYTFEVRDADNCANTTMQNVAAPNAIIITGHEISDLDCEGLTRNVVITFTGRADGVPNFLDNGLEISTDNGQSYNGFYEAYDDGSTVRVELWNMAVGNYPIIIRDANNCTSNTYTVNVAGGQNLFINLNSTTDETCAGANDGTITVSYGGGVGTYYLILLRQYSSDEFEEMQTLGPVSQPGDYTFTNVPVFLPGGFNQYLVRVVDGFSGIPSNYNFRCAGSVGNIFIYPNTPFNSGTAQITGPLLNCYGNNGQITITGTSGGTAPYEFSQDGEEFQSSNVFSGLGAQNSFYVRDSRGCKQGPINITIPSAPVTLNATATLTNSETACTKGSIQVNITGGTGPFEVALIQDGDCSAAYLFAAVTSSTSIPFTELSAGNYTVCIRDAGGCRADRSVAVPFVAEPNMVVTATQSTTCFGGGNNGAITLQASGGTPPYTITINNGSPQTGSNSFNFSSLAPGSYLFQLTDAKGCTDLLVGNVPSNNLLSASVDADAISGCAGGNTGVIRAIPYDGVAPYTVTWLWDNVTVSGVAENQIVERTGMPAGVYQVRITDAIGCQRIETEIVETPLPLSANLLVIDALCSNVLNGSVTINAVGGWEVYEYALGAGPFQTDNSFENLAPGNYTVTVRDTSNCTVSYPFTIGLQRVITANATPANPACFGQMNGSIAIAAVGGGAPYTYSANNGTFLPGNPITGLGQGTYTVVLRDNGGCEFTINNIQLTEPPQLTVTANLLQDASCANNAGNLSASPNGGTPGYSYQWDGNPALNLATYNNAPPGMHTVVVTDSRGCTASASATVSNVPGVALNLVGTTNALCNLANGTATVAVQGGIPPFNYTWSHNAGLNSPMATGLAAGPYSVTVTDGNNCSAVRSLTVAASSTVSLNITEVKNSFCQEGNGRITVAPVGGTPPFNYTWSHNAGLNSPTAAGLFSGSYSVTVTDGNNCQSSTSANISLETGPTATLSVQNTACQGNTGSVQVLVSGGTGPYTYTWSHDAGLHSNIASNLFAGVYFCTVTDANGCIFVVSTTVTTLPPPTAFVSATTATCSLANGSAQALVSGGTAPYTYNWSSGSPNSPTAQNLAGGDYVLLVTDAFGCQTIAQFTVGNIPGPTGLSVNFQNSLCTNFNGSISVSPQGGTGPFNYVWSHNAFLNQATANLLPAGTYSVTATDANGCQVSATQTIVLQGPPTIQTVQQINSLCQNGTGLLEVAASGTGLFQYTWTGGVSTGPVAQNLNAGNYTVTVSDANNCQTTRSFNIALEPAPAILLVSQANDFCGRGLGSIRIRSVGGSAPITFSWSHNPALSSDWLTGLTAGTYSVTATDANGCQATAQYVITETPGPELVVIGTTTAFCGNAVGLVGVQPVGGQAPYNYSWSHAPGLNSATAGNLLPGTYTVTVTDANGCTATATATVESTTPPVLSLAATGDNPCVIQDAAITFSIAGGAAPYAYAWSHNPGLNSLSANGLATGTYTITATDANGCQATLSATVTDRRGPVLQLLNTTPSTCGFSDGSAAVGASLGQAPYQYAWSHNAALSGNTAANLAAGNYSVTVTDANGCTDVVSFNISDSQAPQAQVSHAADAVCMPNSGSMTVSASGGVGPYQYAWSHQPGLNSATAGGLAAGSYVITVTDSNGCQAVATGSIGFQAPPSATAAATDALCEPNTGAISVSVSGGQAPYNIAWNIPALSGFQPAPVFAGSYSATITDANGCVFSLPVEVNFIPGPTVVLVQQQDASCGQSDGSVQVGEIGGAFPYFYSWSHDPQLNFFIANNLPSGNYTVSITDANGCSGTLSTTLADVSAAVLTFSADNSDCGQSNGSATVSAVGGALPLSYAWSHNAGLNSPAAANLPAGLYSVTVTDANGCIAEVSGEVEDEGGVSLSIAGFANAVCEANSGSITLTATGGTGPYQYIWSHNAGLNQANATGLTAGTYRVTATDANGCQDVVSQTLTFTAGPQLTLANATNSLCQDGNGALSFTAAGGTGALSYQWSHQGGLNAGSATGLSAGSYTLTVTDANGCTATQTAQISLIAGPQLSIASQTDAYCGNDAGALSIAVTGGTGPFQYLWSHDAQLPSASANNLSAGTYSLTATDANGCVAEISATVADVPGFTLENPTVQATTCGNDNGQIQVTLLGGQAPFQYQWSHSATLNAPTATGLPVGVYGVTVSDATGCTRDTAIAVQSADGPVLSISQIQNATCGLANGSMATTISGGQAPFDYAWSNGSTQPSISGLAGGAYQLTVTDANGCQGVAFAELTAGTAPVLQLLNTIETGCTNAVGALQFVATGGQAPYSYAWSHNAGLNSASASGLAAGNYTLSLTDAAGCTATAAADVQAQSDLGLNLVQTQNAICTSATGSAQVSSTGGQGPYSFAWSHDAALTTGLASNLVAGSYSVTATDAEGCTAQLSLTVGTQNEPPQLALVQTTDSDCNGSTGSIEVSATGAQGPYTFVWSHDAGLNSNIAGNLSAAGYTVTATDANGCAATLNAGVSESGAPSVSIQTTDSWCGQPTGTATVPEVGNFSYAWESASQPGAIISTNNSATGLAAGTYAVTVTNAQGCEAVRIAAVQEIPDMVVSHSATAALCFGAADGSATVVVTNGGTGPFEVQWSNHQSGNTAVGLAAGNYQYTVTDANGCTETGSTTVSQPAALSVNPAGAIQPTCQTSVNGSISVQVGGGTQPYDFQWDSGQQTANISGLAPGDYRLTVTDANGCQASFQASLTAAGSLSVSVNTAAPSCAGLNNGSAAVTTPGVFTYQWSVPGAGSSLSNLAPGSYSVTVSNAEGCVAVQSFVVPSAPAIQLQAASTPACLNDPAGTAMATATGGAGGFTYLWSNAQTGASISNLLPGVFTVTATDANGCTQSEVVIVEGAPFPSLTVDQVTQPDCLGQPTGTAVVSAAGGTGMITYLWSDPAGQTTAAAGGLLPGAYTVTATDENGCSAATSVTIDFPADFIPTASGIQLPLCFGQSNGAAAVTVQGGSGSFSYQWNDPAAQTGAQAMNLAAGNYSVSVTDNASGCVEILNLTVAQPPVLQLTASNTQNALCAGQSNGSATVSATGGTGVYTYLWNDPAAQTGPTASNLPAGTYTATITDANGCTAQTQVELNEPQILEAQIAGFSAPLCFGQSNGSATVAVTGGTGSYSYQWNDPALQNSATAANLAPGNYTVTVRDANNCPATTSVTIPNTPQIVITPLDQTPPLCAGSGNGSLSATAAGGTGTLNFQWSNGQSSPSLSGLTAGNYTLSVTDGNGCVQTRSFSLLDPDALVLTTANTTPATCYTGADGSISIGLQGGTGAYVYLWSDPASQTTATASGLARGDYSVTATDANGCTIVEQFSITSLGLQIFITPIVANTSCEGAANANISLGVSGGAGGFSYAWSGGQSGSLLSNVGAGTYVVTATDAAGCTETAAITVENGAPFRIDIGPADTLLCEGERFFVDFSNTDYTVQWTSLSGFSSQAKLTALSQADTYFLRVTNAQGCAAFDTIRVAVVAEPLQAFFVIPTDVVVGQEVVALEGSWPLPGQVNWYFPTDSVELLRREGDQYFFRFTQVGNVRLRMQSILGGCEDWIQKVITVHADSTTIPGLNPDEPDMLGIVVAPNPNDGQFSVQVALSGPKDIVLSLYNINGVVQERRIRQGQSSYTENFVVSGQPGTYFLIVQSPKQRRTYAIQVVGR